MLLYRALARLGVPLVPLVLRGSRQRAAHQARLEAPARLELWARQRRDPTRPLAWFHAPSVGEGLQAAAVIKALRDLLPDLQLLYTHYSPSAESLAAAIGADWNGYLCYDRTADVNRMLGAAAPDLLVFTKLDLWPTLATNAAMRGTCVAMVAATVSPESRRMRWPAREIAGPGYRALALVAAAGADEVARLAAIGCRPETIVVGGDPRVDSVLQGVDDAAPGRLIDLGDDPANVMIAGSTWPADEQVLLTAFVEVRERFPAARLVLAPHDPSDDHLQGIDVATRDAGLPGPVLFSQSTGDRRPAVMTIDRTGLLARLYASGGMAYVGGGFGRSGIHSVLEPAAWSRPVIVGPHDRASRDARLLDSHGGIFRLPAHRPATALAAIWSDWLAQPERARATGLAARQAVLSERGAATRTAQLLAALFAERQ